MNPTTSTLLATLCLTAACASPDPEAEAEAESSEGGSVSDGTGGGTSGSSGAGPSSGTTTAETDPSVGSSSTGYFEDCVVPGLDLLLECPDDAPIVGVAGMQSVDSFEFEWELYDEACGIAVTAPLYFTLPDDIISFSLVVQSDVQPVLFSGVGHDGVLILDILAEGEFGIGEPPLKHVSGPTANLTLPMSPDTYPVPGCLAVLPTVLEDAVGAGGLLQIATRRGDPLDGTGRLPVNAIRVSDAQISDEEINAALVVADNLYVANDAGTLTDITLIDLATDDGSFIPTEGPEIDRLRSTMLGGSPSAINVFFIDDFTDASGFLGIAAGIPGPNGIPETVGSGVVVALASHQSIEGVLDTTLMGETIAHEVGHQLGLFHTSESDGSEHDLAPDTAECTLDMDTNRDGQLAAEECPDGDNVMFWTSASFSQELMSLAQSDVLFYSPVSE